MNQKLREARVIVSKWRDTGPSETAREMYLEAKSYLSGYADGKKESDEEVKKLVEAAEMSLKLCRDLTWVEDDDNDQIGKTVRKLNTALAAHKERSENREATK